MTGLRRSKSRRRRNRPGGKTGWNKLLRSKFLLINLSSLLLIGLIAAVILLNRGDRENDEKTPDKQPQQQRAGEPTDDAPPRKKPPLETGLCRVYTEPPGFVVFIDGEPVRTKGNDGWLTSPCAVTVPQGTHEVTVARAGFRDTSRFVNVTEQTQVVFEELPQAGEGDVGLLNSAYFGAETARPLPLISLNAAGRNLDPFITPDGRSLYFVGERNGRKGIYHVARETPYHYFPKQAELIKSTYDFPASPTLADDSLAIVYTLPKEGRIECVSRNSAVEDFRNQRAGPLQFRASGAARWISADIIRDPGRAWRLYWLEKESGKLQGYTAIGKDKSDVGAVFGSGSTERNATRKKALAPVARQQFEKIGTFELRGNPPCFSRDGLRQYVFNGKLLKRATRKRIDEPFSSLEPLANISLPNYSPTPDRRSFSITDDEQWLVYESAGDLYLVRVFAGRGRGFVFRGKSIPPLAPKVVKVPRKKPPPVDPKPKPPKVDPRTLPLPYPVFRKKLLRLLRERKYDEAKALVEKALRDPKLKKDRNLLAWDRQEVERTAAFWKDLKTAVAKLNTGEEFSIGSARVKFVKFTDGTFIAESTMSTVKKPANEMRPVDLISIIEKKLGRDDPAVQLHVAHFWYFDAKGSRTAAISRFKRAGEEGAQFPERLAARLVQQAEQEFDRDNPGAGLLLARKVLQDYPKTKAATEARQLVDRAYRLTKWVAVGPRNWQMQDGVYTAAKGISRGSLLRSPEKLQNFALQLEWKTDVQNGQGGVYFRYTGSGDLTENAFKIHLGDDYGVQADRLCTGSLFKIEAPTRNAVKPRGEWNTLRLRVEGEQVRVTINAVKVLETTAKSESIPLNGYVALDGGLGGITYRKTLLVELP